MMDKELDSVIEMVQQLWPRMDMNPEIKNIWWMAIHKLNAAEVIPILRDLKLRSSRIPQPAQINAMLSKPSPGASETDWESEDMKVNSDWKQVDERFNQLTEMEKEQHKKSMLNDDWQLKWMEDQPVNSNAWKALIVKGRLDYELQPTDADEMRKSEADKIRPPEGTKKGNLGTEQFSSAAI